MYNRYLSKDRFNMPSMDVDISKELLSWYNREIYFLKGILFNLENIELFVDPKMSESYLILKHISVHVCARVCRRIGA